jgi:hypothetical protein
MRLNATRLGSIASSRSFGDQLDDLAGQVPNLDLNFAQNKSLIDDYSGTTLVTFTRAGSATFVDSNGVLQSAVTNLLLRSEEFGTTWTPTGASVSSNVIAAPNGSLTADALIEDSSTGDHRINQASLSVSSGFCTYSIYVKANTRSRVAIQFDGTVNSVPSSALVNVDLSTGTTSGLTATGNITSPSSSISALLDGWYRVSVTASLSAATTGLSARLFLLQNTGGTSYTGNGTGSVYLWGAQLEQSSTVGDYVPTTSTINSAPRFDHNPTTGESLGLLVEEPRTNNFTYSEDTSQWLTPTNITLSQNQTTAPDNLVTADQYLETTATGLHVQDSVAFAFVTSTVYTYSVFVKSIGGRNFEIGYPPTIFTNRFARFNLSGSGSVQGSDAGVTASIQAYANGWYRCSATNTCASGASSRIGNFIIDGSFSRSYAGDITKGLFIWGAQLEAGAFPTSYIPTLGTPGGVTRAADVASITGAAFSSFYNQTEGTVFADINTAPVANIAQALFDLSEGVGSERMFQRRNTGGFISTAITDNNVVQGDFGSVQVSASGRARSGFAYRLNDFEAAVNGSTSGTDTSATVPTPDRIHIGQNFASAQVVNGTIKRLTYWPTRLSNTVLQAITQ